MSIQNLREFVERLIWSQFCALITLLLALAVLPFAIAISLLCPPRHVIRSVLFAMLILQPVSAVACVMVMLPLSYFLSLVRFWWFAVLIERLFWESWSG